MITGTSKKTQKKKESGMEEKNKKENGSKVRRDWRIPTL